jgi:hypothetical protein
VAKAPLEHVDGSSGAVGTAVNRASETLVVDRRANPGERLPGPAQIAEAAEDLALALLTLPASRFFS